MGNWHLDLGTMVLLMWVGIIRGEQKTDFIHVSDFTSHINFTVWNYGPLWTAKLRFKGWFWPNPGVLLALYYVNPSTLWLGGGVLCINLFTSYFWKVINLLSVETLILCFPECISLVCHENRSLQSFSTFKLRFSMLKPSWLSVSALCCYF